MREGKIHDNLGFITWIAEQKTKNRVDCVTLLEDALRLVFQDGKEVVESYERIEKTLDEWLSLVREVYNNPALKYVKFDRTNNTVKVGDKIIDEKRFEENLKDKLMIKIEYECILNNIPYTGIEKLYRCKIPEIMDICRGLELCIKNYCPSRKPVIPVSLEIKESKS